MDIYLRQNFKGQRTGVSIPIHSGTSPTSQHANQSLQKSFHLCHIEKNFKIFLPPDKKIKTHNHTDRYNMTVKLNNDNGLQRWTDRRPTANSVLPQLAVTCKIETVCCYQTFVQVDSEVLRNRQLRQHANLYSRKVKKLVPKIVS